VSSGATQDDLEALGSLVRRIAVFVHNSDRGRPSVPAALAACYLFRRRMELRWLVALVSPLFIASCLYWFPPLVNGVANNAEYGAWFGVAVMMWGFGGVCASIVVLLTWTFVERARNR
jgi:hypothetical protein